VRAIFGTQALDGLPQCVRLSRGVRELRPQPVGEGLHGDPRLLGCVHLCPDRRDFAGMGRLDRRESGLESCCVSLTVGLIGRVSGSAQVSGTSAMTWPSLLRRLRQPCRRTKVTAARLLVPRIVANSANVIHRAERSLGLP
jgi:hypothetical protein